MKGQPLYVGRTGCVASVFRGDVPLKVALVHSTFAPPAEKTWVFVLVPVMMVGSTSEWKRSPAAEALPAATALSATRATKARPRALRLRIILDFLFLSGSASFADEPLP